MSLNVVPVTFVATWVSPPEPDLMKILTLATAELAFHATRTIPPSAARVPRPGFISTSSLEAIAKDGLFPDTPSGNPFESAHTTCM